MNNNLKRLGLGVFIGFFSVSLLFCLLFFGRTVLLKGLYPIRYENIVEKYAETYGLEENFLFAVIETESGFNETAVSSAGAMGLMQILPETFCWLQGKIGGSYDSSALFEPEIAIKYGAYFYALLYRYYGDMSTAVAAYHAGMGNVDAWLSKPVYSANGKTLDVIPFPSTEYYVKKIARVKAIYDRIYE